MTLQEIKELSGMGFTNDQIMELNRGSQEAAPVPDPTPDPAPAPAPAPAPDQTPGPAPAPAPAPDPVPNPLEEKVNQLQKGYDDLLKQMQANNLKTASVNILPEQDITQKAVDALSELIAPKKKEDAKK